MRTDFIPLRAKPRHWRRVAKIRLRALEESPEWFSGNLEKERARKGRDWKAQIRSTYWVIFQASGKDVGLMTIGKADPARGTDCWIGGCWVTPELRGRGIMRSMISELDLISAEEGWVTQGLGVWPENEVALRAYERSGFAKVGEVKQSISRPEKMYQLMVRSL